MQLIGALLSVATVVLFCPFPKMPPLINDVATDLEDPPSFVKAEIGPLPEETKPTIRESYPDLQPLEFPSRDKATVFEAVAATAKGMPRWTLTYENAAEGVVEGYAVTRVMRFRDDFVIRVRAKENGSVVDMRSRSRLGKSDLGANANRIREFLQSLKSALPST